MTDSADLDFRSLLESSPNPYMVLDRELSFVWMNEAYLDVTMRKRDELIGEYLFDAFPSEPGTDSYDLLRDSLDHVLSKRERDEIALIRYDISNPDGGMETRFWSATHTPFFDQDGEVALILQHTVDVTELHRLRKMRDEMGLMERAGAVQARNRDLAGEASRMRDMFKQVPAVVVLLDAKDLAILMANEASRTLDPRLRVGLKLPEAVPELAEQGFIGLLDQARGTGEPAIGKRTEVWLDPPAQEAERQVFYFNYIYQPITDANGQVTSILIHGQDVTEEVRSEDRMRLLINELNHRVKNTLAIVQGLAGQSFSRVEGAHEARAIFDSRLKALAAAHNLLTESTWSSARLSDLVRRSVEATVGSHIDRIDMTGANISLPPQTGVSLAMIIHELSTNALKYGALSDPDGCVKICWHVDEADDGTCNLKLEWSEHDGPLVEKPSHNGFGTRLIQRGLSSEKGSKVEMDFASDGLRCGIETALTGEHA